MHFILTIYFISVRVYPIFFGYKHVHSWLVFKLNETYAKEIQLYTVCADECVYDCFDSHTIVLLENYIKLNKNIKRDITEH